MTHASLAVIIMGRNVDDLRQHTVGRPGVATCDAAAATGTGFVRRVAAMQRTTRIPRAPVTSATAWRAAA